MTSEDVRNVTFERAVRGYRPEDVDDFLQQIAIDMDALVAEKEESERQKEEIEGKMYILAQKVEEYRGQEETLKTALLNAQRMGETVVYEAKQKAESMVREASGKADLLRQKAEQEIDSERFMLEKLRDEVGRFKATVLSMYRQHIESFSALDAPVLRVEEFLTEYKPGETYTPPQPQASAAYHPVEEPARQAPESTAKSFGQVASTPAPVAVPVQPEQEQEAEEVYEEAPANLFAGVSLDTEVE